MWTHSLRLPVVYSRCGSRQEVDVADDLNGGVAPNLAQLSRLPEGLKHPAQWALAGASKAPLSVGTDGKLYNASVTRPSEWLTFEQALYWAAHFKDLVTTHTNKQGLTVVQTGLNIG